MQHSDEMLQEHPDPEFSRDGNESAGNNDDTEDECEMSERSFSWGDDSSSDESDDEYDFKGIGELRIKQEIHALTPPRRYDRLYRTWEGYNQVWRRWTQMCIGPCL